MGFDDLDDLLGVDDELEAAFRELDAQIQLDALRRDAPRGASKKGSRPEPKGSKPDTRGATPDPLADLKSALDGQERPAKGGRSAERSKPAEGRDQAPKARYLVVVCPSCGAKNRVPLDRLRERLPICGRCKTDLSFTRS